MTRKVLAQLEFGTDHASRYAEKMMIGDEEAITAFDLIPGAWLMQFEEGWFAYRDDEPRLGPFESEAEAARAGLKAWRH